MKLFNLHDPQYRMLTLSIALPICMVIIVALDNVEVDGFSIFIRWVFIVFFLGWWIRDYVKYGNKKKLKASWIEIKAVVTRIENINKIWYREVKFGLFNSERSYKIFWDSERCYKIFAKYEDKEYESDAFIVTPKVAEVINEVVKLWDKVSIYLDQNDSNKYYMDLNVEKIEIELRKIIYKKEWERRNATIKFNS